MAIQWILIAIPTCALLGWLGQVRWLALFTLLGLFFLQQDVWLPLGSIMLVAITWAIIHHQAHQAATVWLGCLLGLLLLLKTPFIIHFFDELLLAYYGKPPTYHFAWVGFAYFALRLVVLLLEFRAGRLLLPPKFTDMFIYVLLPITLLAGPLASPFLPLKLIPLDQARLGRGLQRLTYGLGKKYLLADNLGLLALSPQLAQDVTAPLGAWLVVYVYAWQLYLDFSGYTDIAIGLGTLAGFDLPENFNFPYFRPTLAQFWQNWHISLTNWLRSYVFLPLTRSLLRRKLPFSEFLIGQLVTLTLIALWHGVTVNYLLWGLWHALGLYAYKRLVQVAHPWYLRQHEILWRRRMLYALGVVITFHYVALGWVFFALPNPQMSLSHFQKMAGL